MKKPPEKHTRTLTLSPLALESVRVIAFELREVKKNAKAALPTNALDFSHQIQEAASLHTMRVHLATSVVSSHGDAYVLCVEAEGLFRFRENATDEIIQKFTPLHFAITMLGFLRGMIFQMTAAFPCGSITIPLIDLTGSPKTLVPVKITAKARNAKREKNK